MLLSDFIRHVLGATGTHVGCEHGVCGACTVQIDGAPARSCLALAVQVEGADIRTVEGLAPAADRLSPLQNAFRRQLRPAMRLLYAGHPDVARRAAARAARSRTKPEIREFLSGHLCRCTGYALDRQSGAGRGAATARGPLMLDLGTSFVASVARDPDALAIVDGEVRLSYRTWYGKISALVAAFDDSGSSPAIIWSRSLQNTLAGGHAALGLPIRRHHRHAGELARQGRRDRFLYRRCRSSRPRLSGRFRGAP